MPPLGVLEVFLTCHVPLSIRKGRQEQHPGEESMSVSNGDGIMHARNTRCIESLFEERRGESDCKGPVQSILSVSGFRLR